MDNNRVDSIRARVETKVIDGEIVQEHVWRLGRQEQRCRHIINLRDEGIRRSLIQAGWTPPKGR